MKYVILGSSGFIGRRLCEILTQKHEVRTIPRDMYGNTFALKEYLSLEKPDYIINCAAYGNHYSQEENLQALYQANLINPLTLLEATKDLDYKGLILIGSSSEYGSHSEPMGEKSALNTNTFYGASKVAQTYLVRAFIEKYKKPILIVRPFSVYGPGEADFRFIPTVSRCISRGDTFNLAPDATHDWIYIDDFIDGLLFASKHPEAYKKGVVNLGTGEFYTNQDVVDLLEVAALKPAKFKRVESLRIFDTSLWVADMSFMTGLGWMAQTDIREGLKRTYEHYQ